MSLDHDRTASLMTPAKLAQLKPRPAASPAAWLDQLASDAGHMHVRRLGELLQQLQGQARECDHAPLAAALERVGEALRQLDFGLLQPRGWLARVSKARSAGAGFAQQVQQAMQAVRGLQEQCETLRDGQQGEAAIDRTLLEFEVECSALEKVLDQGARWLQDMRNQLQSREAQGGDDATRQQIEQDTARCELLVARLKKLRAVGRAAQQAHQQARTAAGRRAALRQGWQLLQAGQLAAWEGRIAALAAAAAEGAAVAGPERDETLDAQRELQARAAALAADCRQLQLEEQALAEQLADLGRQLQAAA